MSPRKKELREVLAELVEKGASLDDMAKKTGLEGRVVLFWLDAFGMKTSDLPPQIIVKAREMGHKSLSDYFLANGSKTFRAMAEDLKVSHCTVEVYYRIFAGVGGDHA